MKYTLFHDMYSGGCAKLSPAATVVVRGEGEDALNTFAEETGLDPHNMTCDCCGSDWYIETVDSIEEVHEHFGDQESYEERIKEGSVRVL